MDLLPVTLNITLKLKQPLWPELEGSAKKDNFFCVLEILVDENKLDATNICNMDETSLPNVRQTENVLVMENCSVAERRLT
jgi:hypothetical protein